jgi:hypothetical protein
MSEPQEPPDELNADEVLGDTLKELQDKDAEIERLRAEVAELKRLLALALKYGS